MILSLYRTVTNVGGPFIQLYLKRRMVKGKEDYVRFAERKGKSEAPRPVGPLIWLHAASVGESLSMLPLIKALLSTDDRLHVLVTTGTVSSATLMAERLPERSFHQYVPVDRANYVRRFLDHWRPEMALWAESEFWPNLILETQKRNIPMVLVNGRISPKSFAGWQYARSIISQLLQDFELCLGQTEEDAERLKQLGAKNYKCVGNLKFAVPPLPVDTEELIRLDQTMSQRPRWLAVSTHAGEEGIVAQVHLKLKEKHKSVLSILVPRHPNRGHNITSMLKVEKGLNVAQRSLGDAVTPETDIYLVDTLGELGLFFRLTEIAFVGKSLVPFGGQNPLEALRLKCAVVHGPYMANFQKIVDDMSAASCAIFVKNSKSLAQKIDLLISDDTLRASMIANGTAYVTSQSQVVDKVKAEILSVLKRWAKVSKSNATA